LRAPWGERSATPGISRISGSTIALGHLVGALVAGVLAEEDIGPAALHDDGLLRGLEEILVRDRALAQLGQIRLALIARLGLGLLQDCGVIGVDVVQAEDGQKEQDDTDQRANEARHRGRNLWRVTLVDLAAGETLRRVSPCGG